MQSHGVVFKTSLGVHRPHGRGHHHDNRLHGNTGPTTDDGKSSGGGALTN